MQAGDEIRLVGDPGRRGTFTGRETTRAERPYVQVRFPDRTDWVPRDQVEVVAEGETRRLTFSGEVGWRGLQTCTGRWHTFGSPDG